MKKIKSQTYAYINTAPAVYTNDAMYILVTKLRGKQNLKSQYIVLLD